MKKKTSHERLMGIKLPSAESMGRWLEPSGTIGVGSVFFKAFTAPAKTSKFEDDPVTERFPFLWAVVEQKDDFFLLVAMDNFNQLATEWDFRLQSPGLPDFTARCAQSLWVTSAWLALQSSHGAIPDSVRQQILDCVYDRRGGNCTPCDADLYEDHAELISWERKQIESELDVAAARIN